MRSGLSNLILHLPNVCMSLGYEDRHIIAYATQKYLFTKHKSPHYFGKPATNHQLAKKLEIRHSNLQELHRKPYHWEAKGFSNTACVTVNLTACFITKVHVTEEKFKTFNVVLHRNENFKAKTT